MAQLAERMTTMKKSADAVRGLFESMTDPSVISFGGGSPAWATFPVDELRQIADDILQVPGKGQAALAYGNPQGQMELRQVICDKLLPNRGIQGASPRQVIVVNGGLETMNLVSQAYLNKGDVVLVEDPSFVQCIEIFQMLEATCVPVACDDDGVIVEDLKEKFEKYQPKIIYLITSFHNPAARTTSWARRQEIAAFTNQHPETIVIEDDPYVELRYEGEDIPALKTLDTCGNVVFANSFSKIFSPGARVGYCYAEEEIIRHLYDVKTATNSQTSTLIQVLCAEYFNRGYFDDHITKARAFYKEKRDIALAALEKYMPEGTKIVRPEGGLFIWVELPEGSVNTTKLLDRALEKKVSFLPGECFFIGEGRGTNCMRISFGSLTPEQIYSGLSILGGLIREEMDA